MVLTGSHTRLAPVDDGCERIGDSIGHRMKDLEGVVGRQVPGDGRSSDGSVQPRARRSASLVAVIDVAGFVADLKSQAIDHGFHVHDERHFVETYSLRQLWEVDLHPEEACSGPIDLHLSLDVDPRAMLGFEDEVMKLDDLEDAPPQGFSFPLVFTWTLPPLPDPPNLLELATDLAGIGGLELPVEVSAIDSYPSVTDPLRALADDSRPHVGGPRRRVPQQRRRRRPASRPLQRRQPLPARAGRRLVGRAVIAPPNCTSTATTIANSTEGTVHAGS